MKNKITSADYKKIGFKTKLDLEYFITKYYNQIEHNTFPSLTRNYKSKKEKEDKIEELEYVYEFVKTNNIKFITKKTIKDVIYKYNEFKFNKQIPLLERNFINDVNKYAKKIREIQFEDAQLKKNDNVTITISDALIKKILKNKINLIAESTITNEFYNGNSYDETYTIQIKRFHVNNENELKSKLIEKINKILNKDSQKNDINISHLQRIIIYEDGKANKDIKDMKMLLPENKILKIFNQDIEIIETKENCVPAYISNRLKTFKYSKQFFNETIGKDEGASINDIKVFCERYSIKMMAYDIEKNLICKHIPTIRRHIPSLIFICYNNHIYPIKNNKFLEKIKKQEYTEYIYVINLENELIKMLNNQILVSDIQMIDSTIISFVHKKKLYHSNDDFEDVKKILNIFGLDDKITHTITTSNVTDIIEEMYFNKKTIMSYFPYKNNFDGGMAYCNKKIHFDVENSITIDHSKHYADMLKKLTYLSVIDIRSEKHITDKNELQILNKNYIYIAKPEKSTILMPMTDLYTGEDLIYCKKNNVKFEVLEAFTMKRKENVYTQMIEDLYEKLDEKTFKSIIVKMIGRFSCKLHSSHLVSEFKKIANADETECTSGIIKKLNDEYNLIFDLKQSVKNIYDKGPIRSQILFQSRKLIYEKMKELKLKTENVIQIRTDSITFKVEDKNNFKIETSNQMGKWKIETKTKFYNHEIDIVDVPITFKKDALNDNNNYIYIDYAGSGKTYYIINNLIPTLKDKFIVYTPSQSALKQYRKLKDVKCKCIQNSKIPDENIIIVDEIGMVDKQGWTY